MARGSFWLNSASGQNILLESDFCESGLKENRLTIAIHTYYFRNIDLSDDITVIFISHPDRTSMEWMFASGELDVSKIVCMAVVVNNVVN